MTRRFLFGLIASPLAAKVLPERTRTIAAARILKRECFVAVLIANEMPVKVDVLVDGVSSKWTIPAGPKRWVSAPLNGVPVTTSLVFSDSQKTFKIYGAN